MRASILQRPSRRWKLLTLMQHPITEYTVIVLILLSVVMLLGEYVFPSGSDFHTWAVYAGDAITGLFAVELTARFIVARKKRRFFRRYWPDLISLLPLIGASRFLKLLRVLRLFQVGLLLDRRFSALRGLMRVNIYLMWALFVITAIAVVGAGALAFAFEGGVTPGFESLERSVWWAVHSIIAGEPIDASPRTGPGKLVLVGVMLTGMSLFAVFTGIVSATMIDRLRGRKGVGEMDIDELENHTVICGWNQGLYGFFSEIAIDAELQKVPVLLVNELAEPPDLEASGFRADHVYHLHGDHTQLAILEQAGIRRAKRAIVVADTTHERPYKDRDARTVLATLTIERLNPQIYCVVELMDEANKQHLEFAGVEAILMRNEMSGLSLASACRHPELMRITRNLLTLHRGETMQRVAGPKERISFGDLSRVLKVEENLLLIGVETPGKGSAVNPPLDLWVEPSDYLIVIV